jgi:hypothetical protein
MGVLVRSADARCAPPPELKIDLTRQLRWMRFVAAKLCRGDGQKDVRRKKNGGAILSNRALKRQLWLPVQSRAPIDRRYSKRARRRIATPNVITYQSLPVQPNERPAPPRRSRLRLTLIAFDGATLCSALPDSSDVPALSLSFAIEVIIPLPTFPVPQQRALQRTSSPHQQARAMY